MHQCDHCHIDGMSDDTAVRVFQFVVLDAANAILRTHNITSGGGSMLDTGHTLLQPGSVTNLYQRIRVMLRDLMGQQPEFVHTGLHTAAIARQLNVTLLGHAAYEQKVTLLWDYYNMFIHRENAILRSILGDDGDNESFALRLVRANKQLGVEVGGTVYESIVCIKDTLACRKIDAVGTALKGLVSVFGLNRRWRQVALESVDILKHPGLQLPMLCMISHRLLQAKLDAPSLIRLYKTVHREVTYEHLGGAQHRTRFLNCPPTYRGLLTNMTLYDGEDKKTILDLHEPRDISKFGTYDFLLSCDIRKGKFRIVLYGYNSQSLYFIFSSDNTCESHYTTSYLGQTTLSDAMLCTDSSVRTRGESRGTLRGSFVYGKSVTRLVLTHRDCSYFST